MHATSDGGAPGLVLFLPGAAGAATFWHPVGRLLPREWAKIYMSWPGLGDEPHDPRASWIVRDRPNHTTEIRRITAPTLLLWGDQDPLSPIAIGEHLASLLPDSRLISISGGAHDLAVERAAEVAPLIEAHLR